MPDPMKILPVFLALLVGWPLPAQTQGGGRARDAAAVAAEHSDIGVVEDKSAPATHTTHPDAQWFPASRPWMGRNCRAYRLLPFARSP